MATCEIKVTKAMGQGFVDGVLAFYRRHHGRLGKHYSTEFFDALDDYMDEYAPDVIMVKVEEADDAG